MNKGFLHGLTNWCNSIQMSLNQLLNDVNCQILPHLRIEHRMGTPNLENLNSQLEEAFKSNVLEHGGDKELYLKIMGIITGQLYPTERPLVHDHLAVAELLSNKEFWLEQGFESVPGDTHRIKNFAQFGHSNGVLSRPGYFDATRVDRNDPELGKVYRYFNDGSISCSEGIPTPEGLDGWTWNQARYGLPAGWYFTLRNSLGKDCEIYFTCGERIGDTISAYARATLEPGQPYVKVPVGDALLRVDYREYLRMVSMLGRGTNEQLVKLRTIMALEGLVSKVATKFVGIANEDRKTTTEANIGDRRLGIVVSIPASTNEVDVKYVLHPRNQWESALTFRTPDAVYTELSKDPQRNYLWCLYSALAQDLNPPVTGFWNRAFAGFELVEELLRKTEKA